MDDFFEEFFNSFGDNEENLNLYEKFLNEFEKPIIIKTLKYCNGNQMKAAKLLGLNRNTLNQKWSNIKFQINLVKMIKQFFTSISKFNISIILFLSIFTLSFVVSFLIFISLIGNIPNLE